jgi:Xaa-Pro aminopeptidase
VDNTCIIIIKSNPIRDGTTDTTRTTHFGTPTQEEIECYTRVLKGNLDVQRLKFAKGTNGKEIDTLARRHLWEVR